MKYQKSGNDLKNLKASTVIQRPTTSSSEIHASLSLPKNSNWELDFCSRPIIDERGKKLWELLVTNTERSFVLSEFFPNDKINSVNLRSALQKFFTSYPINRPVQCRFFRGQMQTIIARALTDLDIKPIPSQRCFTLFNLLEDRVDSVYMSHPYYDNSLTNFSSFDFTSLQELPTALRGEQWSFVQLSASELQEEAEDVKKGKIFGSTFIISDQSMTVTSETLIPGVAVFTNRAVALAAWTSGLELAVLEADVERACLILETGVNLRWRYASYPQTDKTDQEAQAWERAKKSVDGLHFLAIQSNLDSEDVAGLWFMQTRKRLKI
jgi:hypothetical protein